MSKTSHRYAWTSRMTAGSIARVVMVTTLVDVIMYQIKGLIEIEM
jgi:hypothetical protein